MLFLTKSGGGGVGGLGGVFSFALSLLLLSLFLRGNFLNTFNTHFYNSYKMGSIVITII